MPFSPTSPFLTGSKLPRGNAAVQAISPFLQIPLWRVRFGTSGLNSSRVCLMCKTLAIASCFPGSRMPNGGVTLTCGSIYRLRAFPNHCIPAFWQVRPFQASSRAELPVNIPAAKAAPLPARAHARLLFLSQRAGETGKLLPRGCVTSEELCQRQC